MGRKMVLPPYPPRSCIYGVKGGTTNSIDNLRTFPALYLRPNDEGGGYFVYNNHTMQRCSACRAIGIKKKPIPMDHNVIKIINKQAKGELYGVEFANIDIETTVNDDEERDNDSSDSDFKDDDKSYETSDDSTIAGDSDLFDGPNQLEEDQEQHFNVPEVNDIDENDSYGRNEGVGEEGVGKNDPVPENEETIHEIEYEPGTEEEDDELVHESVHGDDPSLGSVEIVNDDDEDKSRANNCELDHEQPLEPENPTQPGLATDRRPPAVRKLDCLLNEKHWGRV